LWDRSIRSLASAAGPAPATAIRSVCVSKMIGTMVAPQAQRAIHHQPRE